MALNGPKYKVMHCGKNNPWSKYYNEKEYGIMITVQVEASMNKAN